MLYADADLACEVFNEEFVKEIEMGEISPIQAEKNLATVAIVGENMKHTPGIAGKLFGTLGRNGINVIACAQGASETNISFVVDSKSLRKSLNVIHDSFFLSEYQVLNLFICGIGTVGGSLIEQIRCQQEKLKVENGLKLHVVGIADATKAIVKLGETGGYVYDWGGNINLWADFDEVRLVDITTGTSLKQWRAEDMQSSHPVQGAAVSVSGLEAGSELAVYNVTGSLVSSFRAESDEETVYLPGKGIYIVKNGDSRKVLKVVIP